MNSRTVLCCDASSRTFIRRRGSPAILSKSLKADLQKKKGKTRGKEKMRVSVRDGLRNPKGLCESKRFFKRGRREATQKEKKSFGCVWIH